MRIHLSTLEAVTRRGFTGGRFSKSCSGAVGGGDGDDGAGIGFCLEANRRGGSIIFLCRGRERNKVELERCMAVG